MLYSNICFIFGFCCLECNWQCYILGSLLRTPGPLQISTIMVESEARRTHFKGAEKWLSEVSLPFLCQMVKTLTCVLQVGDKDERGPWLWVTSGCCWHAQWPHERLSVIDNINRYWKEKILHLKKSRVFLFFSFGGNELSTSRSTIYTEIAL